MSASSSRASPQAPHARARSRATWPTNSTPIGAAPSPPPGHAEPIEVLHYPAAWHDDPDPERGRWLQPARGGVDAGAGGGVHWTDADADTPRDALARFLTGRMR
jgi:hypothetical protein